MATPTFKDHATSTLTDALIEHLEAATEIAVSASPNDLHRQHQRWLTLANSANDILALARSLEIITRTTN